MQKFNVRSNCIAPFAWSRMIGSIPTDTPEQQARVAKIQQMTPAKIAPLAVYLASDAAKDVNGQIFAVRNNEIFLMSQPRPCARCTAAKAGRRVRWPSTACRR
jgi:enoyl-[acyl-carrier-protein] reductase (NADH)